MTHRPLIIAHRGARLAAPENTVEAFARAGELGADGVEMDVRRTADGVLVVHHDATLAEDPRAIVSLTHEEVVTIAPRVPRLAAALAACGDIWVDIEVKNNPGEPDWDPEDAALLAAIEQIDLLDVRDRVMISSFNLPTVDRAYAAGLATGWLLPSGIPPLSAARDWPGHSWVLPSVHAVRAGAADQVVEAFTPLNTRVGVWTVNDPGEMLRLATAGVAAIFTDDIALAVKTLRT